MTQIYRSAYIFVLPVFLLAASVLIANPAFAEDVLARVDGHDITQQELSFAEDELGADIAGIPEAARRPLLAHYVIELQLLADAALKAELDKTPEFQKLLAYYRLRALRDLYFEKKIRDSVTEAEAKAFYDAQIGKAKTEVEVRARHILVPTKEEAEKIRKELVGGADFAKLAKEKSKGPSGANGGDLGYFTQAQMVKPFADAAFALKPGELSQPVKTQFGWHIIKLEDRRDRKPPSFEQMKDQIMATLIRTKLQATIAELRKTAKIEFLDPELKKAAQKAEESKAQKPAAADKADKDKSEKSGEGK